MSHGKLSADDRGDARSQDLDGSKHLFMRNRRDAHLESDPRNAAKRLIDIEYFPSDSFGVADQQRTRRSNQGIELSPGRRGPAALLTDFGECMCVSRKKIIRSLLRGVAQKADRVKTDGELLRGVAGAAARFTIEVDELSL